MTRLPPDAEPAYDEGLDPDGPSAADLDRFGDELTVCRECGERFYDQAELCPACGMPVREPERHMPGWVFVTTAAVIVAIVLFWVL